MSDPLCATCKAPFTPDPADYGAVLDCPRCRRVDRWLRLCPPLFQTTDPARLDPAAVEAVNAWTFGPLGLVLHGQPGTGKTRLAWTLLRRLFVDEGREFEAFDSVSFAHRVQKEFTAGDGPGFIDHVSTVPVVLFDDLGKAKFTERFESELFAVIDRRMAWGRPVIATTNMVSAEIAVAASASRGSPLVRRLREFCLAVPMTMRPRDKA